MSDSCTEPLYIYDTAVHRDEVLESGGSSTGGSGESHISQKQLARVLAGAGLNPNKQVYLLTHIIHSLTKGHNSDLFTPILTGCRSPPRIVRDTYSKATE